MVECSELFHKSSYAPAILACTERPVFHFRCTVASWRPGRTKQSMEIIRALAFILMDRRIRRRRRRQLSESSLLKKEISSFFMDPIAAAQRCTHCAKRH